MSKVYITKYALTKGLIETDGEIAYNGEYIRAKVNDPIRISFWDLYVKGKEATFDKQEALEIAEQMRVKKIAALKKQIAKLEKVKFD